MSAARPCAGAACPERWPEESRDGWIGVKRGRKDRYAPGQTIAMQRPGEPGEIVGVCVLLASDSSSYISGSEYRVDGGCLCGGTPWPYDTKC